MESREAFNKSKKAAQKTNNLKIQMQNIHHQTARKNKIMINVKTIFWMPKYNRWFEKADASNGIGAVTQCPTHQIIL